MRKYQDRELHDWFVGKAKDAAGIRRNIVNNHERARDSTIIGKMYLFFYDPKLKAILPIYDRFPLVLPIERYGDGFLGLNLHYLAQGTRKALLDTLSAHASNNKMNENTRLRISYDVLNAAKAMTMAKPSIKRYLFNHVRSKFIEIHANEWDKAIELPVELFVRKK